jgi:hypothetical protein
MLIIFLRHSTRRTQLWTKSCQAYSKKSNWVGVSSQQRFRASNPLWTILVRGFWVVVPWIRPLSIHVDMPLAVTVMSWMLSMYLSKDVAGLLRDKLRLCRIALWLVRHTMTWKTQAFGWLWITMLAMRRGKNEWKKVSSPGAMDSSCESGILMYKINLSWYTQVSYIWCDAEYSSETFRTPYLTYLRQQVVLSRWGSLIGQPFIAPKVRNVPQGDKKEPSTEAKWMIGDKHGFTWAYLQCIPLNVLSSLWLR